MRKSVSLWAGEWSLAAPVINGSNAQKVNFAKLGVLL